MSQILKIKIHQRASVLVFSLIILSFLLVSALSVAVVAVTEKRSAISSEKTNIVFQTADSGVEQVLQKINKQLPTSLNDLASKLGSTCNGADGSITFNVAQGSVKVFFYGGLLGQTPYIDCAALDWRLNVVKIKVVGTFASTTRAVEVGVTPPCGPEIVANGTFTTNTASWIDNSGAPSSIAWSATNGGSLNLDGVVNYARADQALTTVSGMRYVVKATANSLSGPMDIRVGTSLGGVDLLNKTISLAGAYRYFFTASSTTSFLRIFSGWTANVDNVSVTQCEI